jgi:predicted RNase H-like nuclease
VIVGVDGCKGGWIAVSQTSALAAPNVQIHRDFISLVNAYAPDATICVDMPIGLPDQTTSGGRGPEQIVRAFLKKRRSSVFAIPSRSAVYASTPPFENGIYAQAHAKACLVAKQTSSPPIGFSIQAFGIFPKIRELDLLFRSDPALKSRIFESHPEFAFCRLNNGAEMQNSKATEAGINERRQLLEQFGFSPEFLQQPALPKSKIDDFLDACVMMVIAQRIRSSIAQPHPNPPYADAYGIPIAIWV